MTIPLQLGPEILDSYKRLSYSAWFALAEFIDNSTQAYFNNEKLLKKVYEKENENLTIKIESGKDNEGEYIKISDNSIGMSEDELKNAIIIGKIPKNSSGRSRYGLGLKTAACWFGDLWSVTTKKLGENKEHYIEIDVPKIISTHDLNLEHKIIINDNLNEHYTIILIRKLHRKIVGKTILKVKNYLRSMYRIDFKNYGLKLYWQNELLEWNYDIEIDNRLIINKDNSKAKREETFNIKNKKVSVWAGVFEKGSRADAGFSIIQANRIIKGWPDSYRPETIFGEQEGGVNDLVNQRLVGEIFLEGFDVSHTKDEILFTDDEKDLLEDKLIEKFGDLKQLALSYRKYKADQRITTEVNTDAALNEFDKELRSNEIKDLLNTIELPNANLIKKSNKIVKEKIVKNVKPNIKVKINDLEVMLFVVSEMSPNDPYVIIESTENKNYVIVIVNKAHPHWVHLTSKESVLNFLRHCTYDGVAEWKAYFKTNKLNPDTIKLIKDNLLRLPFEIEKNTI